MVDYGIICRNISDKINYFKVHPLTTFSDHCMISTDIDVKIRPASKHIKNELHNFPVKYVWYNESKDTFLAAIQDNLSKNSVNINRNDCIDILTSTISDLLTSAADASLLRIQRKKSSKRKLRKPWFCDDYDKMKKDLNDVNKLFHKYPTLFYQRKIFQIKKKH